MGWGEHKEGRLNLYHSRGSNLGARKTLLKTKVDKYGNGSLSLVGTCYNSMSPQDDDWWKKVILQSGENIGVDRI